MRKGLAIEIFDRKYNRLVVVHHDHANLAAAEQWLKDHKFWREYGARYANPDQAEQEIALKQAIAALHC